MNESTFFAALHENPSDELTWLALADWLDENDHPLRAELVRLTRQLRTMPRKRTKARVATEQRLAELLQAGVQPPVPEAVNSIGMRFALIPAGRFRMGSPRTESGRYEDESAHDVTISSAFYFGVHCVTQSQYEKVMGYNPSEFCSRGERAGSVADLDTSSFPVECVSYDDAQAFCTRLSETLGEIRARRRYRLPTEAEWEYAARAWTTTATYLGATLSSHQANFDGTRPYRAAQGPYLARPCPVGSYPPNAFGLYDMMGNVYQWCSDWYDPSGYSTHTPTDPVGPTSGEDHPLRGGSWDSDGKFCRAAWRDYNEATAQLYINGVRVVLVM